MVMLVIKVPKPTPCDIQVLQAQLYMDRAGASENPLKPYQESNQAVPSHTHGCRLLLGKSLSSQTSSIVSPKCHLKEELTAIHFCK